MNYLQVENLAKSFGDKTLFQNLSFSIEKEEKVALIARNGTGKSSLLKIIAGIDTADSGNIVFRNGISVGYLEQDPSFASAKTVIQQVFQWDNPVIKTILDYEAALRKNDLKMVESLVEKMDHLQAWDYEVKIKQILTKLDIGQFDQPVSELSGGQKKRLALAGVLIRQPDLVILDEPTNHLDLGMVEWLEEYLEKSCSTLLMVTHDRYFLDQVCNRIFELDNQKLYSYAGNYSYFLEKREERQELQSMEIEKARNLYRTELDWIRRMPKARGTKAKYRVESFKTVREKAFQKVDNSSVSIVFKPDRLGNKVVEIYNLSKKFDDKVILNDFSYLFKPYEKVGIVGNNGTGKTTLLNLIIGKVKADAGKIDMGETVNLGYFSQHGLEFDPGRRLIDVVREIADVVPMGEGKKISASQLLYHFMFPEEMHYNYIEKLSGGERRRLYLLTVLMRNPNFLVLDEPTNDLDIVTLNILEDFLLHFKGSVIVVSHDRYFMDKIVDHVFVFSGDGLIKDFPGTYSEYRNSDLFALKSPEKELRPEKAKQVKLKTVGEKKLSYKEKMEYDSIELKIQNLEQEKVEIESVLGSGTLNTSQIVEKSARHSQIQQELETLTNRWLELSEFA